MGKKAAISLCDSKFDKYLKWLNSTGIEYIILDYRKNNFDAIEECSSLFLTGGVDIFPEFYNDWEDGKERNKYKPERDGFEFKLLDYALLNNMPVLGICRGMQLINCKLKGSLINDIETVRKVNHDKINNKDITHKVNVLPDTLIGSIINVREGEINSAHHQAIDRPGEGLKISAKSDDGIIEAIEWAEPEGLAFMIAVQWHPERMNDLNSPFSKNLILKFKEETEKH